MDKRQTESFVIKKGELMERTKELYVLADNLENESFVGTAETIRSITKKAEETMLSGLFSYCLVSQFQVGKSTTANSLAGGYEVLPRGLGGGGLRTSAIASRLYYSDDENAKANVVFKSDDELKRNIQDVLVNVKISDLNIKDSDTRKLLAQGCLETLNDLDKYEGEDKLNKSDLLKTSAIIMIFYDHPDILKFKKSNAYMVDDIQKYMYFPNSMQEKMAAMEQKGADLRKIFAPRDVMSFFITEVEIPVKSKVMLEQGVCVIDPPGLFASENDTRVAVNAMNSSMAILYLLNGEKQLTQEELRALKYIMDTGNGKKVFFAINFKKRPFAISQTGTEGTILSQLRAMGYDSPHQQSIVYYNAYLALLAGEGERLLNDALDKHSLDVLIDDASTHGWPSSDPKLAWVELTQNTLYIYDKDAARLIDKNGLTEETVEAVRRVSNIDVMIETINSYVYRNKARAILVDNGAAAITESLINAENDLLFAEKSAEENLETATAAFDDARILLEKFNCESEYIKSDCFTDDWDIALAEDCYQECYVKIGDVVANKVIATVWDSHKFGVRLKDLGRRTANLFRKVENEKITIKEMVENKFKEEIEKALSTKINSWDLNLEQKKVYKNIVLNGVNRFNYEREKLWESMHLDEKIILKELDPLKNKPTGRFKHDMNKMQSIATRLEGLLVGRVFPPDLGKMLKSALAGAAVFVGTQIGFLAYYFSTGVWLDAIVPGLGVIVTAVAFLVAHIVSGLSDKQAEKQKETLKEAIKKEINATIIDKHDEIISSIINGPGNAGGTNGYRKFYETYVEVAYAETRAELDRKRKYQLDVLSDTMEKRKELAEKAHRIRTRQLEPIKAWLDGFAAEIDKLWPETR